MSQLWASATIKRSTFGGNAGSSKPGEFPKSRRVAPPLEGISMLVMIRELFPRVLTWMPSGCADTPSSGVHNAKVEAELSRICSCPGSVSDDGQND